MVRLISIASVVALKPTSNRSTLADYTRVISSNTVVGLRPWHIGGSATLVPQSGLEMFLRPKRGLFHTSQMKPALAEIEQVGATNKFKIDDEYIVCCAATIPPTAVIGIRSTHACRYLLKED